MSKQSQTRRVRGRLLHGQTGDPLAGFQALLFSVLDLGEGKQLGRGVSGKDGAFSIEYGKSKRAASVIASFARGGPALVLWIYDPDGGLAYISEERSGDERFESWDVAVLGLDVEEEARLLNNEIAEGLEKLLKRPATLMRISRLLARETGGRADPEKLFQSLVDSDPFGIDPFTFRTTVCCILNRFLDEFKQTSLGQRLAVDGSTYKHLGSVSRVFGVNEVIGFIQGPEMDGALIEDGVEGREEVDQDFNFKINPTTPLITDAVDAVERTGRIPARELADFRRDTLFNLNSEYFGRIECEITPCDQKGDMRRFMSRIRAMARQARADRLAGRPITPIEVAVRGEVTFDGTHSGFPGHIEVHPVREARVL